jgi:integrase
MFVFAKVGDITLDEARNKAAEYRLAVNAGRDPRRLTGSITGKSFQEFMLENIPGWGEGKDRGEYYWKHTLSLVPTLHRMSVSTIEKAHVVAALKAIWKKMPPTAARVRRDLEFAFDAAEELGLRVTLPNPVPKGARRLALVGIQPARKLRPIVHRTAVPWASLPALMLKLRYETTITARAVEFLILTGARSAEVCGTPWTELDLDKGIWIIPAERMKTGKEHRVPLSRQAIALLRALPRTGDLVFGSQHTWGTDKPLRGNTLVEFIRRRGSVDADGKPAHIHGFRSTFSQWAKAQARWRAEEMLVELSLAHAVGTAVSRAYDRAGGTTFVEERRELMQAWADYAMPALRAVAA